MKIRSAEFVTSAPALESAPPPELPEFPLVGRSNVGKSSLINCLLGRRIAKTSNTPGKTRLMNFFRVNESFMLVDLPGYGYAKVSQTLRAEWDRQLQRYLRERDTLRLVLHIIDARHGPMANDLEMHGWLRERRLPLVVVLSKGDKISRSQLMRQRQATAGALNLPPHEVVPFSATTAEGRDLLLARLTECLT